MFPTVCFFFSIWIYNVTWYIPHKWWTFFKNAYYTIYITWLNAWMLGVRDTAQQRSIINVLGPSVQNTTIIFIVRFYLSSPYTEMVKFLMQEPQSRFRREPGYKYVWILETVLLCLTSAEYPRQQRERKCETVQSTGWAVAPGGEESTERQRMPEMSAKCNSIIRDQP